MKVAKDHVVSIDYQLKLKDGTAVDSSAPGEPLQYIQGRGQIVPGLERELEGLQAGAQKRVVVQPSDGYGESDPAGVQEVPRAMFPQGMTPTVGQELAARGPQGETIPFRVKAVGEQTVTIDLNHPLAGQELHFDIRIAEVRPASAEELAHGHAHGPGGHHG
jgi:FKBP-type peptidyl-prolyl cis-trans isomerase SlyD